MVVVRRSWTPSRASTGPRCGSRACTSLPTSKATSRRTNRSVPRKLLLHRRQIQELAEATQERGYSLVPLRVYFTHGVAKVELAVARGKRRHEKRQAIAKREAEREMEQAAGRRRYGGTGAFRARGGSLPP